MIRPRTKSRVRISGTALLALTLMAFLLIACNLRAQSVSTTPGVTAQSAQDQTGVSSQPSAVRPPATPSDDLAQMRIDLDRMESLLGNMSSEIEFLRDQNLQILLRTNAQMWRILIRDLRGQIDREKQRRSPMPQPESGPTTPKSAPH
jgi:hypothetical protein